MQYLAIALETKGKLSRNEHSAYGVARRMAVQASPCFRPLHVGSLSSWRLRVTHEHLQNSRNDPPQQDDEEEIKDIEKQSSHTLLKRENGLVGLAPSSGESAARPGGTQFIESWLQAVESRVVRIHPVQLVPGRLRGGSVPSSLQVDDDGIEDGRLMIGF